ncbi:MAG: FlgD immunoglobulin-like domain containing protein, partial [Ignavibacteriota bacterium]
AAYIACGGDGTESFIWHIRNVHLKDRDSIGATHLSFDFSTGNTGRNVSAIAFSPLDKSRTYVLTNDGRFFDSIGTSGKWKQLDTVAPGSHYFYGSVILPSAKDVHTLWIAGSGYSNPGVFVSTDDGKTFSPIDSGLPHTLIYGLAADADEKLLFAATEIGPYVYSTVLGRWFDMSASQAPDMVYWSVEYVPSLKVARFGTYGRGIWDFTVDQIPSSVQLDTSCTVTASFNLSAQPAVFTTSTDITVNLPSPGEIAVKIFDLSGRLVKTFPTLNLAAGYHHYPWDGRSDNGTVLPSGFYTCIASGIGKADFVKLDLVR